MNPDQTPELDSECLATVEVGDGWTEEIREAVGAVGTMCCWSKLGD